MHWFENWPAWAGRLAWTVATIGIAYSFGHLIRAIVGARLTRWTTQTERRWDDRLVAFTDRVPFWAILTGAYVSLRHWSLAPDDYARAVQVLAALAVASFTFALASIAGALLSSYGPRHGEDVPVSALMQNVVRGLVITLGALVIARGFGVEIAPYLTALGVGGLAVALALQDPLSNFFAGVSTSVAGQIRIGDYVKLEGGAEGYVADFNWRATSIRLLSDNIVIVPNAKFAQAIMTNYHQPSRELTIGVDVGVHYLSDLQRVEQITTEVAKEVMVSVPGGVEGFQPGVRFHTFGPTSITCGVTLRVHEYTDQFLVRHEFIKRLHARYSHEGIAVPFPPLDPRAFPPAPDHKPQATGSTPGPT
jgi:small-conductance mechanosensitive channel